MECQKKDRQQQPGVIAATDAVESAEKIVKPVKTISRADELSEIRSYTAKAVKAKAVERGLSIGPAGREKADLHHGR